MRKAILTFGLMAANVAAPAAGGGARKQVALTVYSGNTALVSEQRTVTLRAGGSRIVLGKLADQAIPGSVVIQGKGLSVREQRLVAGGLTRQRLLQRFSGHRVTLVARAGARTKQRARLVGHDGDTAFVQTDAGIESIAPDGAWRIVFPAESGLAAGGSLHARVDSDSGPHGLNLTYLTHGLTWALNYAGRLDASATHLRLSGLASISNHSGIAYPHARIRLIAGQPNQVQRAQPKMQMMAARSAAGQANPAPQQAFEYYAYRLPQNLTLRTGGAVQVPLVNTHTLPVRRDYLIRSQNPVHRLRSGTERPQHAEVRLHVSNNLKQPLPSGTVRLYGESRDSLLWLGSDQLDAVPAGQDFTIKAGRAFDVTARRTQTAYQRIDDKHRSAAWRIRVSNAKQQPATVRLVEQLPGSWQIKQENRPHKPVDARHVAWTLHLPAQSHETLTYRYIWQ